MPNTTTAARTLDLANPLLTGPDVEALQRLLATSYREKVEVLKRVSNAG